MDEPDSQYMYNCDVKSSTVTYPVEPVSVGASMFDDEPVWEIEDPSTAAPAAAAEGGVPGEPGVEGATGVVIPTGDGEKLLPPKYNLHWVKPLFLNYSYLYDYRRNYYDDYIDYLDKRQKGLYREKPRAQEWAERALRTSFNKNTNKSWKRSADMKQVTDFRTTIGHYSYHSRAYYSLKYQRIL